MYRRFRHQFGLPVVHAHDEQATSLPGSMVTQAPRNSDILVSDVEINQILAKETGRDRLKQMFTRDVIGNLSPEIHLVKTATENSAFMGILFGTFVGSRNAMEKFKEANKETVFETKFMASRSYMDWVFLGGVKAGAIWFFRLGLFTFLLVGSSQVVSVYRNKSGPLEFVAGGAVTGGLMRIGLGLKGLVAGGIIGSFIGLMGGTVVYAVRSYTNETQERTHYWAIHDQLQKQKRMKLLQQAIPSAEEANIQAS